MRAKSQARGGASISRDKTDACVRLAGNGCVAAPTPTDVAAGAEPFYMTKFVSIPRDTGSLLLQIRVVVVVVLTLTRIIKSVVTGQAPVTLELRNYSPGKHVYVLLTL